MSELDWCIIPARGGSKRIPSKNIIAFNGKPLIYWTIKFAIESNCFDKVIVSTDDPEIQQIARAYGAEVPFLRSNACDDHSPVSHATKITVDELIPLAQTEPQFVTQLLPNCPIRSFQTLHNLIEFQYTNRISSVISASHYAWFNPFWAHDQKTNEPIFQNYHQARSQDLPEVIVPTGTIWRSEWPPLSQYGSYYSPNYRLFPIPYHEASDIDDMADLRFAEIIQRGVDG